MNDAAFDPYRSGPAAFAGGFKASILTVFFPVMIGTFIGIGALAHGYGFSAWWLTVSTVVMWAGPAQVILMSSYGNGGAMLDVAIAISLSGVR
ncbi:MAG TPA: AzlC family ABC transporter permease, partial [Pseudolabrys sp.]|nr:AzlC family ABC transporter permease [Pseudolabrys sp.]